MYFWTNTVKTLYTLQTHKVFTVSSCTFWRRFIKLELTKTNCSFNAWVKVPKILNTERATFAILKTRVFLYQYIGEKSSQGQIKQELRGGRYRTCIGQSQQSVKYSSRAPGQGACLKGMSRTITMQGFRFAAISDVEKTKLRRKNFQSQWTV